ncbi:dTMP kinase [bacterium]|nr:dTMP kinase [bacterium]
MTIPIKSKGLFISFEGGEGAGKSTQANLLASHLKALGQRVLLCRDPGGTTIGEKIRAILLDREHGELCPRGELLLYLASRAQLVSQVIAPALAEGQVVIADRFHHSTLAYQGGARDLGAEELARMNLFATDGLLPEVTFLLDLPPQVGFARKAGGGPDRMESLGDRFHERVVRSFRELAQAEPERIVRLDASRPVEEIAAEIKERVGLLLGR